MTTLAFAVDENNDIFLGANGNLAFTADLAAVKQCCEHAMKTLLAECVLDLPRGIPYFQQVWNGRPNLEQFDFAGVNALLAVAGVTQVTSFESTLNGERLEYQAIIQTQFGTVTLT